MIELAGRLVEPGAPRRAAVERNARSLVAAENDMARVVRIDPRLMKVVTVGRTLDRGEMRSAIGRTIESRVRDVDTICIFGIDRDVAEVPAALPQTLIGIDELPRHPAVV